MLPSPLAVRETDKRSELFIVYEARAGQHWLGRLPSANKQIVPRTAEKDAEGEVTQLSQGAGANCCHTKEIRSGGPGMINKLKDVIRPVGGD